MLVRKTITLSSIGLILCKIFQYLLCSLKYSAAKMFWVLLRLVPLKFRCGLVEFHCSPSISIILSPSDIFLGMGCELTGTLTSAGVYLWSSHPRSSLARIHFSLCIQIILPENVSHIYREDSGVTWFREIPSWCLIWYFYNHECHCNRRFSDTPLSISFYLQCLRESQNVKPKYTNLYFASKKKAPAVDFCRPEERVLIISI